jgi:opacity protein-like surface antigen
MKTLVFVAAASAAALIASAASAAQPGWYVRGDVGGAFDGKIDGRNGPRSDNGWTVGGGAGRDFGNGFRAEGDIFYLDNNGKHQDPDIKSYGAFLSGYYDFLPGAAWQPFVGAGIGVANVKADGGVGQPHGEKTAFAYQVGVGVAHPINDRLTGELAYKYIAAPSIKIGSEPFRTDGDFSSSVVSVGLRYKLGS